MIFRMFLDLFCCCYCAENYDTEATSCRVFSLVYQNENRNGNEFKAIGKQKKIPRTTLQKFRVEWTQLYSWLAWTIIMWNFCGFARPYGSLSKHPPLLLECGPMNNALGQIINKVAIKPTMPQHPRY